MEYNTFYSYKLRRQFLTIIMRGKEVREKKIARKFHAVRVRENKYAQKFVRLRYSLKWLSDARREEITNVLFTSL